MTDVGPNTDAFVRRVSFSILAVIAAVWIYASLDLRPLFADGFLYFLRILEYETYWLEAPARRTVELVRQIPVLAALKLGVSDVPTLAVVFALSLQLFPLALTWLCWPALPRAWKSFFAFPLLHYLAGTLGAAFVPITEGTAASAWFWLLFLLLLLRPARGAYLLAMALLAIGTMLLHEGMVLLAPVLAAVALWRLRREPQRAARIAFAVLALWFAIVVVVQLVYLVDTSHPANRASYFTGLFSLWWLFGLWGSLNLPALFGIVGLFMLFAFWPESLQRRGAWLCASADAEHAASGANSRAPLRVCDLVLWAAFGLACIGAVVYAVVSDTLYGAQAQMNARNHAILISVPLALVAFHAVARPGGERALPFRHAYLLCIALTAAGVLWHVATERRWSDYLAVFRDALRQNRGLVAWERVLAQRTPAERRLFEGMSHFWIEPSMSIVLAPGGKIGAIIAARREAGWHQFDATKPDTLPRSRFWNYDAYLAKIREQRPGAR